MLHVKAALRAELRRLEEYLKFETSKPIIDDINGQIEEFKQAIELVNNLDIPVVSVPKGTLPTDEEIYSKASDYTRLINNPHNQTQIKLRQAFKNGAKFIIKHLESKKQGNENLPNSEDFKNFINRHEEMKKKYRSF